jgi:hypothetical protein
MEERAKVGFEEERHATRTRRVASGTLACARCDAPVALGGSLGLTASLTCPYCAHEAPVRDFLSLAAPTRPTRVAVVIR